MIYSLTKKILFIIIITSNLNNCTDSKISRYTNLTIDYYYNYSNPEIYEAEKEPNKKPKAMGYGKFGRGDSDYIKNGNYNNFRYYKY